MALRDLQAVLVRLYADRAYREVFFADRSSVGAEQPLTETERKQLDALRRDDIERFANALRRKRLGPVRELTPALARLLGDDFDRRFDAFCADNPSARAPLDEARAFLTTVTVTSPFANDLTVCEQLRLEVRAGRNARPGPGPPAMVNSRLRQFAYDWARLYPLVARGELTDAAPESSWVLVGKVIGELAVKLRRVNPTTTRLLGLFDGVKSSEQAIIQVAEELGLNEFERLKFREEARRLLEQLAASGLLA